MLSATNNTCDSSKPGTFRAFCFFVQRYLLLEYLSTFNLVVAAVCGFQEYFMRTILVLACISVLAACNKPPEPKVEPSASANFLSEQKAQLDKAKEAAQLMQQKADEQRAIVEVQTGGAAAKPAKSDAGK
jgi:hypothetical protein